MNDPEGERQHLEPLSPEEMAKLVPPSPGGKKEHSALLMDDGPQQGAHLRQDLENNDWDVLEVSSLQDALRGMLRTDFDVIVIEPSSAESALSYVRLLREQMKSRPDFKNIPVAIVAGTTLSVDARAALASLPSKTHFYSSGESGDFIPFVEGILNPPSGIFGYALMLFQQPQQFLLALKRLLPRGSNPEPENTSGSGIKPGGPTMEQTMDEREREAERFVGKLLWIFFFPLCVGIPGVAILSALGIIKPYLKMYPVILFSIPATFIFFRFWGGTYITQSRRRSRD